MASEYKAHGFIWQTMILRDRFEILSRKIFIFVIILKENRTFLRIIQFAALKNYIKMIYTMILASMKRASKFYATKKYGIHSRKMIQNITIAAHSDVGKNTMELFFETINFPRANKKRLKQSSDTYTFVLNVFSFLFGYGDTSKS